MDSKQNFRLVRFGGRFAHPCIWSGDDYKGVFVTIRRKTLQEENVMYDCTLHVSNLSPFLKELKQFEPENHEEGHSISPSGVIKYNPKSEIPDEDLVCSVCENSINERADSFSLSRDSVIHMRCIPDFINIMEQVWNHSDEILLEQFR